VGVVWARRFGDTAGVDNLTDDAIRGSRVVAGVRLWY
jgi:uncharacterized protein involved in copper resistance